MNDNLLKIFQQFTAQGQPAGIVPFGNGHINDTYRVQMVDPTAPGYILQRKNHAIFKDIPGMMQNILHVTEHIRKKLVAAGETEVDRKVMTYLPGKDNNYFVQDENGNFWTLFLFVRDSHGIEEVTNPTQAFSAGKAFGQFQLQLADLPGNLLIETIPNFHNGKFRYGQLLTAISENRAGRVEAMQPELDKLIARADEMVQLQEWIDNGELPLRITHNDTKINNVLYDEEDNILCIIDLDTVMPGSALFDFGDAIRTLGNTASEDEPQLEKINFNRDYYRAFAEGYLSESSRFLTEKERENLAFSCRYMVWEQSVRFLIDYLNGDIYYKIAYPEHNKVRTLAQIRYLEVMEQNIGFMTGISG